jgi:cytochrome c oxidase subunit 2
MIAEKSRTERFLLWAVISLASFALAGCSNAPSTLDPQGPAAERIANLWWFLLALGGVVYLAIIVFLFIALFNRNRQNNIDAGLRPGSRIVLFAGIITPAAILLVVFGFTVATLNAIAMPAGAEQYTIHLIGHQWWWEVRYPQAQVITANEIHIPAGRPVRVLVSSDDVIHSFWVPQLHGKIDTVPGMTNEIWLEADRPGIYRGECAEFCGIQHAKMGLLVIAEPGEQFDRWLEEQRQPAVEPTDNLALAGQELFLDTTCINCHTIAGTHATGRLGPDLTHFASRLTIGAATLPNNRGNLGGWVANPQHQKPGALMPPSPLNGSELQAILAYLETLE